MEFVKIIFAYIGLFAIAYFSFKIIFNYYREKKQIQQKKLDKITKIVFDNYSTNSSSIRILSNELNFIKTLIRNDFLPLQNKLTNHQNYFTEIEKRIEKIEKRLFPLDTTKK